MPDHKYHVVDDTYNKLGDGEPGGYIDRDYSRWPLNGLHCARAATIPRMTKQEIKDAIAFKTANNAWASDRCDAVGSHVKNQSQSSYCWIHAPTRAIEVNRVLANDKPTVLSAFYPGSMIKHGRNQGGSGVEGMNWLATHGTCLEELWPPMRFNGNVTPELLASAERHQIVALEELDADDTDLIASYICSDCPVTVGIPAWGHEVLITFLVWLESRGTWRPGFDNSWNVDWGTNGRGVLDGNKFNFDEAGAIISVEPSAN